MIDRKQLLSDLQGLLTKLEDDLLERSESAEVPDVGRTLREEYAAAQAAARTAQSFEEWRSDAITQAAAAWVLSCVFVRFLEDNGLVETPKIAGPGERLKRARDEHELYFRSHPTLTDRDYLLAIFDGLTKHSATKDVFGEHNPIRDLPNWLSGDAAGVLIAFFQKIDPNSGVLVHDFADADWDTRFLGDLYQDLSEAARKKYALLQTPVFVEEFILDRTLDPAIEEFGLAMPGYKARVNADTGRIDADDRFKMIDPACGSGHFLLGSFARLVERWRKKEPGAKSTVLIQRALDSVHGVDLNPFAIAIARFRLLLAALKECRVGRISDTPGFAIHIACGDSLLHGSVRLIQQSFDVTNELKHVYQPEDSELLSELLKPKTYHSVVANPPYITPKDAALNAAYRERYVTCHRQYSLAVPFLERIVSLAVDRGYTGQITANSFMKREFGKKLVESYIHNIDLTHVIDTQCVHLPAHGTATAILLARRRAPVQGTVRLVSTLKNEEPKPVVAERGKVWLAVVSQVDSPGSQSEYVTVSDMPRERFHKHPWSIGGGGASELKAYLDEVGGKKLAEQIEDAGFGALTRDDDVFIIGEKAGLRSRVQQQFMKEFVTGENVRDWCIRSSESTIWPYNEESLEPVESLPVLHALWPYRRQLCDRVAYGYSQVERGLEWFEFSMFFKNRFRSDRLLTFASVATHNHFVLCSRGRLFNRHAPVIKLSQTATEDDHVALLGLLNSSTACFWMKQVFQDKGGGGIGGGISAEAWERRFEHDGTKLEQFPVPNEQPLALSKQIAAIAESVTRLQPSFLIGKCVVDELTLVATRSEFDRQLGQMIALQEELDWKCYQLYGLIEENISICNPPPLKLGQRAFEIVLARKMVSGEAQTTWFERHGSTPITKLPSEWPDDYRNLVDARIAIIEADRNIALIEQPEYKRRWNTEPWETQVEQSLRSWLLDRLETYFDFDGRMNEDYGKPTARFPVGLVSVGRLADIARQDSDFLQVGELYRADPAFDVSRLVAEVVEAESVPFLPVLRYKPSGLRKRDEWEKTWSLQRHEDTIDARTKLRQDHPEYLTESGAKELKKKLVGNFPVPPKYTTADLLNGDFWRNRGKIDVPKECWVSFPHCEGEDGTLMVAWAGYDHLQLARTISAYYVDVQERLGGREDPRLVPLLACLIELLPWLKQWHNEVDPEFGVPMGDYFEGFLQEESRTLGLTWDEIKAWQPAQRAGGRGRRRANG